MDCEGLASGGAWYHDLGIRRVAVQNDHNMRFHRAQVDVFRVVDLSVNAVLDSLGVNRVLNCSLKSSAVGGESREDMLVKYL